MNSATGLFVVIDGPSGVGKTTVTPLVAAQLAAAGHPALATTEPTHSPIGELSRHGTRDIRGLAMACLVAADRYQHLETTIRPALADGKIVVCDRYLPSSLVLQTADGVPEDFVWALHQYADHPHLTILLVGEPSISRQRAAARGTYSRFHDGDEHAGAVERDKYVQSAHQLRQRGMSVDIIDVGTRGTDAVARDVSVAVLAQVAS